LMFCFAAGYNPAGRRLSMSLALAAIAVSARWFCYN